MKRIATVPEGNRFQPFSESGFDPHRHPEKPRASGSGPEGALRNTQRNGGRDASPDRSGGRSKRPVNPKHDGADGRSVRPNIPDGGIAVAATYARVSTDAKGQDPRNQQIEMDRLIARRGWQIHAHFTDHDSGGKSDRPQFQAMMEAARKGEFDVLVFWSLDRFSREGVYETLEHLRILDRYGVRFLSLQEQYLDTLGPFREAVIGILAAVARMERERISERVKAGMARAKKEGKIMGRKRKPIDEKALRRMIQDDWSLADMAKALGVGRSTVLRRKVEVSLMSSMAEPEETRS